MTPSQHAPHDLDGETALITGATAGIGRAAAVQLAAQGAQVIIHGRNTTRGHDVVEEIVATGGTARFLAADLNEPTAVRQLAADAGRVDVLINNAGYSWWGPTADLEPAALTRMFAANVHAPYLLVAALAPPMAARNDGVIINIGSMAGAIGLPGGAAYSATKASLASHTRSWAAEYGPHGVRVLTVSPGPVYTDGATREFIETLGRDNAPRPCRPTPGDRRDDRLPRLTTCELPYRRRHRRRRRAHRSLTQIELPARSPLI
jgi:NAD(P)-dependent dehydrogenase (short-subunit alcohol dehydrogenase family)